MTGRISVDRRSPEDFGPWCRSREAADDPRTTTKESLMSVRLLRKDPPRAVDDSERVALVDAALASLSHREFVTGREATEIFRDLRARLGDAGTSVVDVLDTAVREYDRDGIWGTPTLADALLDLRLLTAAAPSASPTE
jgi:hypothetical protein